MPHSPAETGQPVQGHQTGNVLRAGVQVAVQEDDDRHPANLRQAFVVAAVYNLPVVGVVVGHAWPRG